MISKRLPTSNFFSTFSFSRSWLTLFCYLCVGVLIAYVWSLRDLRLVVASEGLGYALGIIGSTMMVMLLLYPLRKRARFLRNAGPISHWFRIHMILGVAGPVLVLFHSNFSLGSINSSVALFCTIVVASSGIIGRYLYAKIHNGLYGQRITFQEIRGEIESNRTPTAALSSIVPQVNNRLMPIEDSISATRNSLLALVWSAIATTLQLFVLRWSLRQECRERLQRLAQESSVVAANQKRLLVSTNRYLDYRLSVLRKFAQLRAAERLFSLWHIVHYPLFMVLVVAAVVHIVAVHIY